MEQEQKKSFSFTLAIIAIILGVSLFKQIDFKTFTVEKPALAAVYALALIIAIAIMVRKYKGK
ncbi:hypothetical protein [Flavobacterium sp. CAU 1735]|uniref:hypothetical protein n=1 Tax=Flavobacterium sp. CAU 1735 TaxID=3140361 RepID=UPI00325FFDD4